MQLPADRGLHPLCPLPLGLLTRPASRCPPPAFLPARQAGSSLSRLCPHPGSSEGTFWVLPETSPSQLEEMPGALFLPLGGPPSPTSKSPQGVGDREEEAELGLAWLPF